METQSIRVENFGRKQKEDRAFENAALLQLIRVAEHDQAQPLLQQVIDHYNVAYAAWADFSGKTNRVTTLRIGHALGNLSLPPEVEELGERQFRVAVSQGISNMLKQTSIPIGLAFAVDCGTKFFSARDSY